MLNKNLIKEGREGEGEEKKSDSFKVYFQCLISIQLQRSFLLSTFISLSTVSFDNVFPVIYNLFVCIY
jgi:hypothetical protein